MKKTLFIIVFALVALSVFISCNNNTKVVTYKVTVMNGEELYREKNVADGDVYVLPSKPADSRPFKGWKVGESTELMQPGEDLKITGDTKITAVWITSCTVSFDLGDETLKKIEDVTVDYGSYATAPSSIPDRSGYAFVGWYFNEEEFDFSSAVTEDITLKAHWTANYCKVTFDTAGGSSVPSLKIKTGERINFVNEPEPTREGYTFSGWKTETHATFDFSLPIESSMTLTAQWTPEGDTATVTIKDKSGNVIRKDETKIGAVYTIPDLGYEIKSFTTDDNKIFNNSVTIEKKSTILTIEKGEYKDYEIGDIGPGGGYIVFDADYSGSDEMYKHYFEGYSSDTLGWRYLEAATSDLEGSYVFGYYRESGTNSVIVSENDGKEIGKGRSNTASLISKMGKTAYSEENGGDKAEYAAYVAQSYNGGGYSDWFLPSSKELEVLDLLIRLSKGGVKTGSMNNYWTSTEYDGTNAEYTSFLNGGGYGGGDVARSSMYYVRPFRCF